ncbi:dihydroorotate dehydrogenase electron transfer subunit [Candidatus Azobacteroides pseudotrichonymphae]|uniref:Dihydroorotate dehydrogenase electron transfer subunit n=1 Tax=Azobacteroides pseudotrichonymphae genomovar. CFP2 TaxID=511995 RepID=B6YRL8_AZOPC|nr:dihydroorotate dehydrogenase electron transfer subunit [Candidatus Azobacteroides pseudotrichonymphae]BAG83840.1 dihydroorotate dehydrogenase electron transfer subunit [Candidatus Azobacteroides pseudotrichonymphae genomovar. CFP2]
MNRYISDWRIQENILLNDNFFLLKLISGRLLPEILPGQFAQIRVKDTENVFLRRPISIHYIDKKNNELWLLIQIVGKGTSRLSEMQPNGHLNLIYPLGNGFTIPSNLIKSKEVLLIGGGVGIAPLLYLGSYLKERGFKLTFLLGAKTENGLPQLSEFRKVGMVYITTENGELGEKGVVTDHSLLSRAYADFIYSCGPKPMMMAVARYAKQHDIFCEVSLENHMACGIGVCLCCIEKTQKGNTCVCQEGPVFNINQLKWQI